MPYDPNMTFYKHRQWVIPERMMSAIHRYVQKGIKPGDFLYNAMCNRFCEAVFYADYENLQNLPAYPYFFENWLPVGCWGSVENVRRWILKGGLEGRGND